MNLIAGVGMIALSLVMVGSAVVLRQRAGQPMRRYAMIWVTVFILAFLAALAIDRHAG